MNQSTKEKNTLGNPPINEKERKFYDMVQHTKGRSVVRTKKPTQGRNGTVA